MVNETAVRLKYSRTTVFCAPGGHMFCLHALQRELKIILCVIVGYIFYDLGKGIVILRKFTVLYPVADQVAKNSPEIFMPGIGQEAAGIREHAHKAGKIA